MTSLLRRGRPRSSNHIAPHTIWAGLRLVGRAEIISGFHLSHGKRKHHSWLWPEPFSTEHSSLNLSVRRPHGKLRYCLQNLRRLNACPRVSFGRFLQRKLIRPRPLSALYNVERLGGFVKEPSGFANTPTSASCEYSIFGAARTFR